MKRKPTAKRSSLKLGLRGQQIILFLLVSLMPLFTVALTIKVLGENALKSSVGDSLVLLAQQKLYQTDRAISEKIENIYSELPNITEAVRWSNSAKEKQLVFLTVWARLDDSIRLFEAYAGYDSEVTIANATGEVLRSNNPELDYSTKEPAPHRVNNQDWWQKAYNNGLGYQFVEDVTYDTTRGAHVLPIALPIRAESQPANTSGEKNRKLPVHIENPVIGVLRAVLLLPELTNLVESSPDIEETDTFLINQSGTIISASPGSGYSIGNYEISNAVASAIVEAKKRNSGSYYGYEADGETDSFGENRIYGWARTQPSVLEPWKVEQNFSNWIIFVSRPVSSAYAAVGKLNRYIFYVTLASAATVVLIACWAAQRITTPIMQLAGAARNIAQSESEGELGQSLQNRIEKPIHSSTEVGILAEEFNNMRQNLKAAVEELSNEQKKLMAIVENLGEGLIVVDKNSRVLYINPVAETLFKLGDTENYENFVSLDISAGQVHWRKSLLGEAMSDTVTAELNVLSETQHETHHTVIAEINQTQVLRIVTSQFVDERHTTVGTVYLFDDITSEYEIDKMKSEFVSLVSHELRTPLTSIMGFISLILDGKTGGINEKQRESLSRALRQSKRLTALINDLLDVSRIEAGRIEMKQEHIAIQKIAKRRLEELRPQAAEKAITLVIDTEPNLPVITGDADRIGQVFINLIGNAIKFTPDNGKVTVRISRVPDTKRALHAEVIDTGPGIPPEEREKIFDKFHQLGSVQTRQQGGTGLGLGIAAAIVDAHGGKLWADAGANGHGCNFQFIIP